MYRLLEFLSGLLSKGFHPYSVGTPIIIYDRSEILPTLAFGRYLAEMCENKLVISDYNLIYKIIYKSLYILVLRIIIMEALIGSVQALIGSVENPVVFPVAPSHLAATAGTISLQ